MSKKDQILQVTGSEIVVPLTPPHGYLPKPKADAVLTGTIRFKFPNQCAWCNSESVIGLRQVQIYVDNPEYSSHLKRLAKEGAGLAVGAALGGGTGGMLAYGAMKPQEVAMVKGLALNISVPHCIDHIDTSHEGVIDLVDPGLGAGACHIQVYDAEYARTIARINNSTISVHSLNDLVWPNQCVVCGALNPGERYQAMVDGSTTLEGESVEVPVCANELQKLEQSMKANKKHTRTSLIIGVVLGALVFLDRDTAIGTQLFCFSSLGLIGWVLSYKLLQDRTAYKLGVDEIATWKPINITLKNERYLLDFQDAEIAEVVRRANGLIESAQEDKQNE